MAFYLKLAAFIAALRTKIPKAIEFLTWLADVLEPVIDKSGGTLQIIQPSAKVLKLEEKIASAMSTKGRQKAIDFAKLRALAAFFSSIGAGNALLAMLKKYLGL